MGILAGCGEKAPKVTATDAKAFEGADPELKVSWDRARASGATNDYVGAILTLRSLLPRNLSPAQRTAVENAMGQYDGQMMKAVNRGDPAATKALEALRSPGAQLGR